MKLQGERGFAKLKITLQDKLVYFIMKCLGFLDQLMS
jgi:hypothetical protein